MAREADSIGLLAAKVLKRARQATVLAAFERSFYLDADGDLIAVIRENLPEGPLNIRVSASWTSDLGITTGQHWSFGAYGLTSIDGLVIDVTKAEVWRPKTVEGCIDRSSVARGLDALKDHLAGYPLLDDGLARLVLSGIPAASPIEQAAAPAIDKLERALLEAFQGRVSANVDGTTNLIGLGPGLTPSGDDLLGGVLIACHQLHENAVAKRLGDVILKSADRTNVISQAHLRAAALGYGTAPLHDLLDAIIRNDRPDIAEALDATAKIGHSSGIDALAGIILALQSYLAATSG
jgi:hypothetical protein